LSQQLSKNKAFVAALGSTFFLYGIKRVAASSKPDCRRSMAGTYKWV